MKKLIFISLAVCLALTTFVSVTAFAKDSPPQPNIHATRSFNSVLTPTAIDPPVVSSAPWPVAAPPGSNSWRILSTVDGKSSVVGWIVDSRSVYGNVSGDLSGLSTFTYGGILDTLQSGSIQGILIINTGGLDSLYLAASGTLATAVKEYYPFTEIAAWCQAAGFPVGMFFAQIYEASQLALLPDGKLTFSDLQAWCGAIGLKTGPFLAGLTGNTALAALPDTTIQTMYGTVIPLISGLQLLGGMYGVNLPSLPKTLSAEFSGTLSVDKGTGVYNDATGQGRFGAYKNKPLTLQVSPAQHVISIAGAIQLSGTYNQKPVHDKNFQNPDRENVRDWIGNWKNDHKDK